MITRAILVLLLFIWVLMTGCSTAPSNTVRNPISNPAPAQTVIAKPNSHQDSNDAVQRKMTACIAEVSASKQAKLIDGEVLAISDAGPNAKAMYSSPEKISDEQAKALKEFKWATQKCRQISNQFKKPALRKVYQDYFSKIDVVYADLISQKITIGVANQERALLMNDARMHWKDEIKKQY